jgi:hypothetical protein
MYFSIKIGIVREKVTNDEIEGTNGKKYTVNMTLEYIKYFLISIILSKAASLKFYI